MRIFLQHLGDGSQLSLGEHAATGVARRVDHEHLSLGRDGLFELLCGNLEVVGDVALDNDGHAASQLHHFGVGDPERGGDDDFVAVVDDSQKHIVDGLLGTVRNQHISLFVVEAVVALASIPACLADSGVLKSGSPMLRLMTSMPWAFSSRLLLVMAKVADSAMFKTLLERMISLMIYVYVLIICIFGIAKVGLFLIGRAEMPNFILFMLRKGCVIFFFLFLQFD